MPYSPASTKVEDEPDMMVAEIWRLWLQSGNAEVDGLMQHAVLLMGSVPAMAMPILDDIVARLPDWAVGWNKRATVLYLIGEYDRSLVDCDRVLALEPKHFGALEGSCQCMHDHRTHVPEATRMSARRHRRAGKSAPARQARADGHEVFDAALRGGTCYHANCTCMIAWQRLAAYRGKGRTRFIFSGKEDRDGTSWLGRT